METRLHDLTQSETQSRNPEFHTRQPIRSQRDGVSSDLLGKARMSSKTETPYSLADFPTRSRIGSEV